MTEILGSLDYEKKLFTMHCLIMEHRAEAHRNELYQMLQTIEAEVHTLSKLEVIARQNPAKHNKQKCVEQALKINDFIDHLEQHLTFACLLNG
jgi:hypothetical protein